MTTDRIGFIGLGRMGVPMARHLADAGYELMVHNRTTATAEAFAHKMRCAVGASPSDVGAFADVVILMLADGPAVIDIIAGADGLTDALRPDAVVVDMGTTGFEHTAEARALLEQRSVGLVEAPVSGSTAAAEAKSLLVMAAGEADDIERVTPVLAVLSSSIIHVGGPGAGAAMKLAVNSMIFAINQSIAEALVLAERSGVPRSTAYDVFASSAAAAPVVHYRRPVFEAPGATPVTFSIDLARKDLTLILDLADAVGAVMPQATTNRDIMDRAAREGLGGADMGEIATFIRTKNSEPT